MLPQRGVYPQRPTIQDRTTAQYKGMLAGAPGEEEEIIIPQMQAVKTQPSTFTKISVYCLTPNGSKYHEGKVSPVRTVHRRFSAGLQATLSKKGSSHLSFLMLLLGQLKVLTSI